MNRPRLHATKTAAAGARRIVGAGVTAALTLASTIAAQTVESQRIGGLKAEIAALIVSGQQGGEIDLAVAAIPSPRADDERARVALWIEARGDTIFPGPEDLGRLEIYAYVVTSKNGVSDALLETIVLDEPEDAAALRRAGLRFTGELSVPAGDYSLRVLLREVESGRMGARNVPLTVPDFTSPAPRLLTPSSIAPARDWFSVQPVGAPHLEAGRTTQPVLPAERDASLTARLVGGDAVDAGSVVVVAGENVLAAEVAAREAAEDGGGDELTVHFDTSPLAPGWHELTLRLPNAGLESPPVQVVVAQIGEATSWVALSGDSGAAEPQPTGLAVATTRRQRRAKIDRKAEGRAYRAVLVTLCDATLESPERDADRLLHDFERRVLRENSTDVLPELEKLQAGIAIELSKTEPRALAPIILLHSRAYSYYFSRREFLLSTFSRRTLVRLGNLYLKRVGENSAKAHGADVFTSLGAELQARDHGRLAVEMFKRALEIEPSKTAAQIGLAMTYERGEAYEEAIYALKQILDRDPNAWESRLRLALCELRIDRRIAGIRNLRRVIGAPEASAWVRTVAYQELARWHLRREEYDQAIELLEEAIATLPFDTQVRVLLAYAHDAERAPWSARDVLGERPGDGETVTEQIGDSPRRYYAERENSGIADTLRRLDAWDAESRPYLAKLLIQTAAGESSR